MKQLIDLIFFFFLGRRRRFEDDLDHPNIAVENKVVKSFIAGYILHMTSSGLVDLISSHRVYWSCFCQMPSLFVQDLSVVCE